MSSFEKVVKNACKPKAAPPKSKYLDPIVAATWSEDGAVHDVCKALSPRFREPNAIVVFKALIVLHTMIRNGATDNVLSYLSGSEVLRLKNVYGGQWEGYKAPQNLQNYAMYLDSRIRGYRELKHDAIRVQSESNRDARLSMSLEEDARRSGRSKPESRPAGAPQRSKTVMGRKLRVMTVEKGLLRETKAVHKMIDALVECRFYMDDLEDELSLTALRMLVKDLLILFQAGNEGVINVLEHYFEMSHVDAEQALAIYRHFCKQTEHVVEYLGVAKKLQNLLNVPIPNMKHAPVSLVGALEEYLNDPNFEQNRIEYKTNKEAAERSAKSGKPAKKEEAPPLPKPATEAPAASSSTDAPKPEGGKALSDFFSAIEEEQQTMFNPQTNSPTANYFQQQAAHNPFVQRQMTGGFQSQPFGQPQIQFQNTGFIQPQMTAVPFQQQQQPQSFSAFLQPQTTGFLQPQATGSNPFRQSTLMPQTTGLSPFGPANPLQPTPTGSLNPFPTNPQGQFPSGQASAPSTQSAFNHVPTFNAFQPSPNVPNFAAASQASNTGFSAPARPSSTPITAITARTSSPPLQPVKSHQTGSRNPFGAPQPSAPPPMPKAPTLMELAMGGGSIQNQQQQQQQPMQTQQTGINGFGNSGSPSQPQGSVMANVASAFSFNKPDAGSGNNSSPTTSGISSFTPNGTTASPLTNQMTSTTTSGSTFSDSIFSALSGQPTGATSTNSAFQSSSSPPLKPQTTGFSGMKAFKPTSSFGATLLESLPPIPQSAPTTPAASNHASPAPSGASSPNPTAGLPSFSTGLGNTFGQSSVSGPGSGAGLGLSSQMTGLPALNGQQTGAGGMAFGGGSTVGVGLRPQMTGAGGANPFRATMFSTSPGPGLPFGGAGTGALGSSNSTPAFGGQGVGGGGPLFPQSTGAGLFSGAYGQQQQQQGAQQGQQQNGASLI